MRTSELAIRASTRSPPYSVPLFRDI
ncbi:hypothetical protein Hamer_G005870 [Homarus americanus]|uniref:Uncharacterized protein n=1 Tax=Homarus americanus TaxID=6706 RepID=A0A8J5JL16_HOMAM|nr:hypothetical protein Hamer_G005870 [Homarus americanus]